MCLRLKMLISYYWCWHGQYWWIRTASYIVDASHAKCFGNTLRITFQRTLYNQNCIEHTNCYSTSSQIYMNNIEIKCRSNHDIIQQIIKFIRSRRRCIHYTTDKIRHKIFKLNGSIEMGNVRKLCCSLSIKGFSMRFSD